MKTSNELRTLLRSIDHKGYPAYKALAGAWRFESYVLVVDHVQGDPFASPSAVHVELPLSIAGFPSFCYRKACARIALQDYLTRQMGKQFEQYNFKAKGSGKSGLLAISKCGQVVMERSACRMTEEKLIVRFHVGFPAFGRSIQAGELEKILFEFLPHCVENSLLYEKSDKKKVEQAIFLAEDQEALRRILCDEGIVSFVANGAILPRKSGVSDLPLQDSVAFVSPKTMERSFELPHRGVITGMAISQGVTLIVGGGYHGKSTLLEAIQTGVYNHIEGDGREFVITDDTAVKLRAEDGRSIRNVDISLFINDLPNGKDTVCFSTEDASGSTSQAAGVIESMEAGSRLFLIDEDTSATNFMVRDNLMKQIICREKEPITPFVERVRALYEQADISTILVAGSSGAFFYVADHVIMMDCYCPVDITEQVKKLCRDHNMESMEAEATKLQGDKLQLPQFERILSPKASGQMKSKGMRAGGNYGGRHEHMKVKAYGLESFSVDKAEVNVRYLEQLLDSEQTLALSYMMRYYLEQMREGRQTVRQIAEQIYALLDKEGWGTFCGSYIPCGLAKPRVQELYACMNRYRG